MCKVGLSCHYHFKTLGISEGLRIAKGKLLSTIRSPLQRKKTDGKKNFFGKKQKDGYQAIGRG